MVNATMNLENVIYRILCLLKVPVHVACESKEVIWVFRGYFIRYLFQDLIALMRIFLTVHFEPMTIESPEKVGMLLEKLWVGTLHEIKFAFIGRIVIPKPLISSKVRQP
jgi:hypothetical protein